MPRATRPVASLAIPQADEFDLFSSKPKRRLEHPAVVALVSVFSVSEWAEIAWGDMKGGGRLGGEVSGAPIAVGEIDRLFEKGRLVKRNVELGPIAEGEDAYERNNRWMLDSALRFGADKVDFVCLWNGEGGDGPGGTRHMMDEVRHQGGRTRWLDTNKLWG